MFLHFHELFDVFLRAEVDLGKFLEVELNF